MVKKVGLRETVFTENYIAVNEGKIVVDQEGEVEGEGEEEKPRTVSLA